jgi:hypothetical protein
MYPVTGIEKSMLYGTGPTELCCGGLRLQFKAKYLSAITMQWLFIK